MTFRLLELDWIFTNTGKDIIYANVKSISLTVSVISYSTVIEVHFTKVKMSGPSSTKDILKLQENASIIRMVRKSLRLINCECKLLSVTLF